MRPAIRAGDALVYPSSCTSAYCGRGECSGCRLLPQLSAFKARVKASGAIVTDRIWCPNVYTATRDATAEDIAAAS